VQDGAPPTAAELTDGFALTGFFLARHAFEPRGLALAEARAHFVDAVIRYREPGVRSEDNAVPPHHDTSTS
jgi:DNA repair protein RecO (recombination protein O)